MTVEGVQNFKTKKNLTAVIKCVSTLYLFPICMLYLYVFWCYLHLPDSVPPPVTKLIISFLQLIISFLLVHTYPLQKRNF